MAAAEVKSASHSLVVSSRRGTAAIVANRVTWQSGMLFISRQSILVDDDHGGGHLTIC
jgi:hypothetical protein